MEEIVVDQTDAISAEPPKGAPPAASMFGMIFADDFADWKTVSDTAYPLYAQAEALSPGSPLLTEIAYIKAGAPDAKARALAALELVEDRTRYLALMLNAGGLTPAPAELTWSRRFGDCKGKTVLLLALLHGLGIQAEPALVSTTAGEALDKTQPKLDAFDHVIVRAVVDGRTYWLDATRVGDRNLDIIPVPNYRWALPVRAGGAALEPLSPPPPALPLAETVETIDLTAGVAKAAKVHDELILRGDEGWAFGMLLTRATPTDRDRALKAAFANSEPWVTPNKVGFVYDPQKMEARATLDGTGAPPFTTENQGAADERYWMIASSSIGYDPDFSRRSDYHRDAPYAVAYPVFTRASLTVRLPDGGKTFEALNGDSVNRTVAGVEYDRAAAVVGDRFTMIASARAIAQSFPASEAAANADALRSLADYQVSLQYTAPKQAAARSSETAKTDGSPQSQAETAFLDGDYSTAEAMFTKMLADHPTAKLYYDRGTVRAAQGQTALAKADFAASLKLDSANALADFALGRYALREGDDAEAERRFADSLNASADSPVFARRIVGAEDEAKRFSQAAPHVMRASSDEKDSDKRASYLNGECWRRATAGQDLRNALDFCNTAVTGADHKEDALDSRGLVELRLGMLEAAVKDYTQALTTRPEAWSSLYGRALAEQRLGRTGPASADRNAALAVNPAAQAMFEKWGLAG